MKKKLILLLLLSVLFFPFKINAQEKLPLTVFPAIQDIKVTPNQSTRFQIQFKNGSNNIVTGNIKAVDYYISDDQGTPNLLDNTEYKNKYGASGWIKPAYNQISIPPNDFVTVDFFVTTPGKLESCGNYAAVYFEPNLNVNNKNNSGSSISAKIVGLVNFETTKDIDCKEELTITNLSTSGFQEYGPIDVSFNIANNGNIHSNPKGYLQLNNFFSETIDQQIIKEQRIFPESQKKYDMKIGSKWMIGKYKIALKGSYGQNTVTSFTYIWVFPWRIAIIIIIALIIIFYLLNHYYANMVGREKDLEKALEEEKETIERLKEQIRNKRE